jgi:pyruvate,orthophosphate dikinase
MIPLVSTEAEIKIMKDLVINIAGEVQKQNKIKIEFMVGTMIELPRAAIKAKEIAKHAEFFSFGTNDLTQTTFGNRDDSGKFLNDYLDNKIFIDPEMMELDLIEIHNKKLKLGCGEHGGDPKSIEFCSRVGSRLCFMFSLQNCKTCSSSSRNKKNKYIYVLVRGVLFRPQF